MGKNKNKNKKHNKAKKSTNAGQEQPENKEEQQKQQQTVDNEQDQMNQQQSIGQNKLQILITESNKQTEQKIDKQKQIVTIKKKGQAQENQEKYQKRIQVAAIGEFLTNKQQNQEMENYNKQQQEQFKNEQTQEKYSITQKEVQQIQEKQQRHDEQEKQQKCDEQEKQQKCGEQEKQGKQQKHDEQEKQGKQQKHDEQEKQGKQQKHDEQEKQGKQQKHNEQEKQGKQQKHNEQEKQGKQQNHDEQEKQQKHDEQEKQEKQQKHDEQEKLVQSQEVTQQQITQNIETNVNENRFQSDYNDLDIDQTDNHERQSQEVQNSLTKMQTQNVDSKQEQQHDDILENKRSIRDRIEQANQQMECSQFNTDNQIKTDQVEQVINQSKEMVGTLNQQLGSQQNLMQLQSYDDKNNLKQQLEIPEQQTQEVKQQIEQSKQSQYKQNQISQSKQPQVCDQSQKRDEQIESEANQQHQQIRQYKSTNKLYHSMSFDANSQQVSKVRGSLQLHHAHSQAQSVSNLDQPNKQYTSSSYAFLINKLKNSPSKKSNSKSSKKDNYSEHSSPNKSEAYQVMQKEDYLSQNAAPKSFSSELQKQRANQGQCQNIEFQSLTKQQKDRPQLDIQQSKLGSSDNKIQPNRYQNLDEIPAQSLSREQSQQQRSDLFESKTLAASIVQRRAVGQDQQQNQNLSNSQIACKNLPQINQADQVLSKIEQEKYQKKSENQNVNSVLGLQSQIHTVKLQSNKEDSFQINNVQQSSFTNQKENIQKIQQYQGNQQNQHLVNLDNNEESMYDEGQIQKGITSLHNVQSMQSIQSIQNPSINNLRNPVIKKGISGVSDFDSQAFISNQIDPVTVIEQQYKNHIQQLNQQPSHYQQNESQSPIKRHMKDQNSQQVSPQILNIHQSDLQLGFQSADKSSQLPQIEPTPQILINMPTSSPIRADSKRFMQGSFAQVKIQQPIQFYQQIQQSENVLQNSGKISNVKEQFKHVNCLDPSNDQNLQNNPDQVYQDESIEYNRILQQESNSEIVQNLQNSQKSEQLTCQPNLPVTINAKILSNSRRFGWDNISEPYKQQNVEQNDEESDKGIDHDDFNLDGYESRPVQSPERQQYVLNQAIQQNIDEQINRLQYMLAQSMEMFQHIQIRQQEEQNIKYEQKEQNGKLEQHQKIIQEIVQPYEPQNKQEKQLSREIPIQITQKEQPNQIKPQIVQQQLIERHIQQIQKIIPQVEQPQSNKTNTIEQLQSNKKNTIDTYAQIQSQNTNNPSVRILSSSSNNPPVVLTGGSNYQRLSSAAATITRISTTSRVNPPLSLAPTDNTVNQAKTDTPISVKTSVNYREITKDQTDKNQSRKNSDNNSQFSREINSNKPMQIRLSPQNFKKASPTKDIYVQMAVWQIKAFPDAMHIQHLPLKIQIVQTCSYRQDINRQSSSNDLQDIQNIEIVNALQIKESSCANQSDTPVFQQTQKQYVPVPQIKDEQQADNQQVDQKRHQKIDPIRKSLKRLQQPREKRNQNQRSQFGVNNTIFTTSHKQQAYYKQYNRKSQQVTPKNISYQPINDGVKQIAVNLKNNYGNAQNKFNRTQFIKKQNEQITNQIENPTNQLHHLGNHSFNKTYPYKNIQINEGLYGSKPQPQMPISFNISPKFEEFKIKTDIKAINKQETQIDGRKSNFVQNKNRNIFFNYQNYENPSSSASIPEERVFVPVPRRSQQIKTHNITLFRETHKKQPPNSQQKVLQDQKQTRNFDQIEQLRKNTPKISLEHNFSPKQLSINVNLKPAASIYIQQNRTVSPIRLKRDIQHIYQLENSRQAVRSNNSNNFNFQTGNNICSKKQTNQINRQKIKLIYNSNQSSPSNPGLIQQNHSKEIQQYRQDNSEQAKHNDMHLQRQIRADRQHHHRGINLTPNKFFASKSKGKDDQKNNKNKPVKTKIKVYLAKKNHDNVGRLTKQTDMKIQKFPQMVRERNKGLQDIQVVESDYNTQRNEEIRRHLDTLKNPPTIDLRKGPLPTQFIRNNFEKDSNAMNYKKEYGKIEYRLSEGYYDYDADALIRPQKSQKKFEQISPVKGFIANAHGKTNSFHLGANKAGFNSTDYQAQKRKRTQTNIQKRTGITRMDQFQKNTQFIRNPNVKSPSKTPNKSMEYQSKEKKFPQINKYTKEQFRKTEVKGIPRVFFDIKNRENN